MIRPFYFEAKSEQEADLHIYGPIGSNNANYGDGTNNTAYALVSLIKRLDKVYSRINIHINSPGGAIDEGLAIYNTIKQAKAEIHTFNSGLTASMASILMLAGTSHMPKTSIYHLHRASTMAWGNVNDFEQTIEALKTFESTLKQAISEKTGMEIKDIEKKWFDGKEHYMTAEQAAEYGFVDNLEETKAKTPASLENLQTMKFNQVMELYNEVSNTNQEPKFWDKVKSMFIEPANNLKSDNNMPQKLAFRAKLTILLALIGLQEFILNAENKVEMDLDHAYKINDELEAKTNEINNLKVENGVLREEQERLQANILELQAKLDGKPSDGVVTTRAADNSTADDANAIKDLDKETSDKLKAYNKTKRF
jgi:ATP-dependent Clp endopeptidase proteolytic subunit ClpP